MKVILLEDIQNLGRMGDEIKVKDGYARNYLIPRKLVAEATGGALKMIEKKRKEQEAKEKEIIEKCQALAQKIKTVSCTISVEAQEEDKLFGSVTQEMIAEALRPEGIEIDKKNIIIEQPIKTLGVHNVVIKLHPKVDTELKLWVVKK